MYVPKLRNINPTVREEPILILKEKQIEEAVEILESFTPEERAAYLYRLKAVVNTPSPWTKEPEFVYNENKNSFQL